MKPEVMAERYAGFKRRAGELLAMLTDLAASSGNREASDGARSLVAGLNAPFLFVVVGEVKSGKSSFVNALLGADVCPVAPDPCTDRIQQITHSSEPFEEPLAEQVVRLGHPADILKEISIVDTPGTNSVIAGHQEITERFIPESDLVVFVFPAVNPYVKTAWEFLDFVHERWLKKVVFVLAQADRASAAELEVNAAKLGELAVERGVRSPRIFTVSAKKALEGEAGSGIEGMWEFIRAAVTGGRHYELKMCSVLDTAGRVLERVEESLAGERAVLEADRERFQRISERLDQGLENALADAGALRDRMSAAFSRVGLEIGDRFEDGLGFGALVRTTLGGVFGRKNALKTWLKDLGNDFNTQLSRQVDGISSEGAERISAGVARCTRLALDELKADEALSALAVPRAGRERFRVIGEVAANVMALLSGDAMSERIRPADLKRIGDHALMGGFITAVGAVIAASAHAVVFDVTGGVFAALGAFLAVNTLAFKRRGVIRRFRDGVDQARERFETELSQRLSDRIGEVFREISQAFDPFFKDMGKRGERLEDLEKRASHLRNRLKTMRKELGPDD